MGLHDLRTETEPVCADDVLVRNMPEHHLAIIGVVVVRIQFLTGPLAHGTEGLLPQAVQFTHGFGGFIGLQQIGPVVSDFEQHPVAQALHFLPDAVR